MPQIVFILNILFIFSNITYPILNINANTTIVPTMLAMGTPACIAIHTQHSLPHWIPWIPECLPHIKHTWFWFNLARVPTVFNPVPEPGICLDPHGMFGIFGTHLILKVGVGGKSRPNS